MFRAAKALSLVFLFGFLNLMACQDAMLPGIDEADLQRSQQAIINGERVTGNDMLSTVAILDDGVVACSGTLISPNYVLTAAHCISNCKGSPSVEGTRRRMKILVGQDVDDVRGIYEIDAFHPHEDFVCNKNEIVNDIAILKLETPVPSSIAKPTPPMPPQFDLTVDEVNKTKILLLTAGFGRTGSAISAPMGKKYKANIALYAMCSWERGSSKTCGRKDATDFKGYFYFDSSMASTCAGDSGGPSFMTRHGVEYVIAVTSFGYDTACKGMSASVLVSDYYPFILGIATDIDVPSEEICDNGIDDSSNGLIDCADPTCATAPACLPEICDNGIDDNGNGLIDCADARCLGQRACIPEDCSNGIDDNFNGLIDCADPKCAKLPVCLPEICDNGLDDNGDALIDCADPKCVDLPICKQEICDNGIDDNANGLVDCADPKCVDASLCLAELCDNGIDDNGNGLVDCDDPRCARAVVCSVERCDNGIDDDDDGQVDCNDPDCCDSISCGDSPVCDYPYNGTPLGCSATPRELGRGAAHGLWPLLMLLAFAWRRRSAGVLVRSKN